MIFPNSPANTNLSVAHIPQFLSPAISLPFTYNGTQINYRDSSWLKLNVCELFLKNECPNIDNCSLAHPPNTVKIESNTVTVCYDYIKKKDCKHGNCKYYHPHDALSSAILRRGDDSKKNGNALNNIGLNIGIRSPLQINRSHELLNLPNQNLLSSQINSNLISDSQLKNKIESYPTLLDVKKVRYDELEHSGEKADLGVETGAAPSVQYVLPQMVNNNPQQLQSTAQLSMPGLANTNMNSAYNILNSTPMHTSTLTPYTHLSPLTLNNLMLQSLLTTNQNIPTHNHGLDVILGLSSAQKLYPFTGAAYPQVNMAQLSLLNQLYYQQLYQNSLTNSTQMLYPGSINIAELQQRSFEETSVAFINDKGTILETLPVCKDFLQGKCKRNQSCNYVHLLDPNVEVKDNKLTVCKNALKGQCHRPVCKFYHIPSYQLQKLGFST